MARPAGDSQNKHNLYSQNLDSPSPPPIPPPHKILKLPPPFPPLIPVPKKSNHKQHPAALSHQHQQNRHRILSPKRPDHTAKANKNSQYKFPKPVHNRSFTRTKQQTHVPIYPAKQNNRPKLKPQHHRGETGSYRGEINTRHRKMNLTTKTSPYQRPSRHQNKRYYRWPKGHRKKRPWKIYTMKP